MKKIKKNSNTEVENQKSKEVVDWLMAIDNLTNGWNDPGVQEVLKQQIKDAGTRSIQEHKEYEDGLIEQGRKKGVVQGLCLAIAETLRGYGPREVWEGAGLSLQECIDNEVEQYDYERLEHEFGDSIDDEDNEDEDTSITG